jgi:hypothetical protein
MENEFHFTDGCLFTREEAIQDPEAVIAEFFKVYPIKDVKVMVWKFFYGAMTSNTYLFNLPDENSDLLMFFETFIMYNMAVYEQHRLRKETG